MSNFGYPSHSSSQNSNSSQSTGGFFYSPGKYGTPSPHKQEKQEFLQNVVPCTVAQLLKVTEEECVKIGNNVAYIITAVGKLSFVQRSTTQISFNLDDMSGPPINVKLWLGFNETNLDKFNTLSKFPYSRVIGRLRFIRGERFIHAMKVIFLEDVNEISMHILEVIHTAMTERLKDMNKDMDNLMETIPSTSVKSSNINENMLGLSNVQIKILQCISATKSPIGVSYDHLFSQLKTMNKHAILEAVEFLCNEGHLYNTIDDDHFKATDDDLFK